MRNQAFEHEQDKDRDCRPRPAAARRIRPVRVSAGGTGKRRPDCLPAPAARRRSVVCRQCFDDAKPASPLVVTRRGLGNGQFRGRVEYLHEHTAREQPDREPDSQRRYRIGDQGRGCRCDCVGNQFRDHLADSPLELGLSPTAENVGGVSPRPGDGGRLSRYYQDADLLVADDRPGRMGRPRERDADRRYRSTLVPQWKLFPSVLAPGRSQRCRGRLS